MAEHQYRQQRCRSTQSEAYSETSAASPSNAAMQDRMHRHQHAAQLTDAMCNTAFEGSGLRPAVFDLALQSFRSAYEQGLSTSTTVTIIDYELHSSDKRLWVINLEDQTLLFHEYTAHGVGSDRDHDGLLDSVSNTNNSNQSNVGLMKTAETYNGAHGASMRLDGLEAGFNDNARPRNIVIHPSWYVDNEFVERHGRAGRSHGCPALDPDVSGELIQTIKGGSLVFAYYPDPAWLERSTFLNGRD